MERNHEVDKEEYKEIVKSIKKYTNLFKALYQIDQAVAGEFKKKNEFYFNEKHKNKKEHTHGGCCGEKFNNKSKIN